MPYIKPEQRKELECDCGCLPFRTMSNPGELNYKITLLLLDYLNVHDLKYQTINDIMGALEGAKAEFYRRVAIPYEDKKIKENGDVY